MNERDYKAYVVANLMHPNDLKIDRAFYSRIALDLLFTDKEINEDYLKDLQESLRERILRNPQYQMQKVFGAMFDGPNDTFDQFPIFGGLL